MLLAILACCTREELVESSSEDEGEEGEVDGEGRARDAKSLVSARQKAMKDKVLALGQARVVLAILRCVYLFYLFSEPS